MSEINVGKYSLKSNHKKDTHVFKDEPSPLTQYVKGLFESISNICEVSNIERILDIGAGQKEFRRGIEKFYHKSSSPTPEIWSQDVILEGIKHNSPDNSVVSDSTKLPFADNSMDLVHLKDSYCHIKDRLALMKEINRVLKPNGLAIICFSRIAINNIEVYLEDDSFNLMFHDQTLDHDEILRILRLRNKKDNLVGISPPYYTTRQQEPRDIVEKNHIGLEFIKSYELKLDEEEEEWYGHYDNPHTRFVTILKNRK
jgi:SAM-dependent methyltransferase